MTNNCNFSVGDFVHFPNKCEEIYQIIKIDPYWYKGRNHIELKKVNSSYRKTTAKWKIVHAEPELLI